MGKLGVAAAAMGAGGTGAAGIYGAHSMGLFGGGGSKGKQVVALAGQITGTRASYSDKCLKDIFQEATVDDSVPSLDTNFTWKEGTEEVNACLVYSWEKKNKEDSWRDSKFHLIWTMAKGDEGVAVHLTATVKSSSEMEFGGYAYVFGKKEDKWKATHKLGLKDAVDNRKTLSSGDWKKRFPKMGEHFTRKGMSSDYWEFLDDGGTKVRESGSNNNMWWKWRNTTNPNYNMKYWTSNLDEWWDYFFGKEKMDMKKLMGDLAGDWSA